MQIHPLYLLLALALLLPPAPLPADFRKALRRSSLSARGTIGVWQNWLDVIRAALGVYFLMQAALVGVPTRAPLVVDSKFRAPIGVPTNALSGSDTNTHAVVIVSTNPVPKADSKTETAIITPTNAPSELDPKIQAADAVTNAPARKEDYAKAPINMPADPLPGAGFSLLALKVFLLLVVVLVQTIRLLGTMQVVAPVFYLCGLTLVMGGFDIKCYHIPLPVPGAFAVAVGWLFAVAGKNLNYQLPAMAVAAAVAGYVLEPMVDLVIACGLIFVPLVVAVLLKKRLWFVIASPARV